MGADAFVGLDVHGEPYNVRRGAMITEMSREAGVVASLFGASGLNLDNANASRLGRFLLEAADVDLIGAARKVVEARQTLSVVASQPDGYTRAFNEFLNALDTLAAELAKLEGGA
jgi:hypothetical protein